MDKPNVSSLLDLANENRSEWEELADTCLELAAEGELNIASVSQPMMHQESRQRIYAIEAVISHDSFGLTG